jgi:hypothetical protein
MTCHYGKIRWTAIAGLAIAWSTLALAEEPKKPAAEPKAAPAAGKPSALAKDPYQWNSLFDGKTLNGWKAPSFGGEGEVTVKDGTIVLGLGEAMTGVAWNGGELPKVDYELAFEGMRTKGVDFFCTTTFPVGDSWCSFVVGGWAGTVVGLSSIDYYDASDNTTTGFMSFKDKQWYRIRVRVTKNKIQAWIDDEKKVDFTTTDHKISIRFECDPCKPLGISSWCTEGRIRDVRLRKLKAEEVAETEAEK